jgi:hypothetical protein
MSGVYITGFGDYETGARQTNSLIDPRVIVAKQTPFFHVHMTGLVAYFECDRSKMHLVN